VGGDRGRQQERQDPDHDLLWGRFDVDAHPRAANRGAGRLRLRQRRPQVAQQAVAGHPEQVPAGFPRGGPQVALGVAVEGQDVHRRVDQHRGRGILMQEEPLGLVRHVDGRPRRGRLGRSLGVGGGGVPSVRLGEHVQGSGARRHLLGVDFVRRIRQGEVVGEDADGLGRPQREHTAGR
jgi:hypothetical protein